MSEKISLCEKCLEQERRCAEAWKKWRKTEDFKNHLKEVIEKNT